MNLLTMRPLAHARSHARAVREYEKYVAHATWCDLVCSPHI
jgi:hypothetical protein